MGAKNQLCFSNSLGWFVLLYFDFFSHHTLQGVTKVRSAPFLLHLPLKSFMCAGSPIDLAGDDAAPSCSHPL